MAKTNIEIRKVKDEDARFLYKLLLERSPKVNISHKKMPSYKNHIDFIKSEPYSKWFIILYNNKKIGSTYLTNINEIGMSLVKEMDTNHIKNEVLKLLMRENPRNRYLVNINPNNIKSINFFKKKGFQLIQYTFELLMDEKENEKN